MQIEKTKLKANFTLPTSALIYLPILNLSGLFVCVRYHRLLQKNATSAHRWEKPRFPIPVHVDVFCSSGLASHPSACLCCPDGKAGTWLAGHSLRTESNPSTRTQGFCPFALRSFETKTVKHPVIYLFFFSVCKVLQ